MEDFPLHRSIFQGKYHGLFYALESCDVAQKDKHGNTALHLAVMLGKREFVDILLSHGAPAKVKNLAGWTPLAEAISYGDRHMIRSLLLKTRHETKEHMKERHPKLVKALQRVGDFYMELRWDFHSWLPLLSRMLPSDVCKIHKKGTNIRMDSTLMDYSNMRWERGDVSFIFNGVFRGKSWNRLTILDNQAQVYHDIQKGDRNVDIEEEIDILMSTDIVSAQMSTKSISFTRDKSGWIFREDRKEMVGDFHSDFYLVSGLVLESRKRREHLSEDDVLCNKAMLENIALGQTPIDQVCERRESLPPPPKSKVTWEEYISAEPGGHPPLGREQILKEVTKGFKATVAMSSDFPLTVDMLLNVLEVIAPFKHFTKLREFIQVKLPPGFPVKLDIPVVPAINAKITFQHFEFRRDIPDSLFEIPSDYTEDPSRFPDF